MSYRRWLKKVFCLFLLAVIFLPGGLLLAQNPSPKPQLKDITNSLDKAGGEQGMGLNMEAVKNPQSVYISIGSVINIAINFAGIITILLLIYAGWLWMTASGVEEKITQAKKIATGSVLALIIIACAWLISRFVFYYFGSYGAMQ